MEEILQQIDELLTVLEIVCEDISEFSKTLRSIEHESHALHSEDEPKVKPKKTWFDDIIKRCPECGKVSCKHPRPRLSSPWAIF